MGFGGKPSQESLLGFRGPRPRLGYLVAVGSAMAVSAVFLPVREQITPLSKGFGFLLVVGAAAAIGGLWPGVLASILGFISFNYFFISPYGTPYISRLEDVAVLFVYLVLSVLISALLGRSQQLAALAEGRRQEFELFYSLSADLVEVHAGQRRYQDLIERVVSEFGFERGSLFVHEQGSLLEKVTVGTKPETLKPWWEPTDRGRTERLPLLLGGKAIGSLVLWAEQRPALARGQSRILRGLCDQLAVVLESDRLKEVEADVSALRNTDSKLTAIIAAVSHELRSRLEEIQATVNVLLASEESDPATGPAKGSLRNVHAMTDSLISIVGNLLDMSRLEGGQLRARISVVSLQEVIATAVERVRAHCPRLRVYVSVYENDVVRADVELLGRVLANLLDHATRGSLRKGTDRIEVLVTPEEEYVKVAIIDHAEDVPHESRERLFHPFYQDDEQDVRLGDGFGLAIAKDLVSIMGGGLWVEDTPGGGSTIAFSLPVGGEAATAE